MGCIRQSGQHKVDNFSHRQTFMRFYEELCALLHGVIRCQHRMANGSLRVKYLVIVATLDKYGVCASCPSDMLCSKSLNNTVAYLICLVPKEVDGLKILLHKAQAVRLIPALLDIRAVSALIFSRSISQELGRACVSLPEGTHRS